MIAPYTFRVFRGGGWSFYAALCRAAFRFGDAPGYRGLSLSFRCARRRK